MIPENIIAKGKLFQEIMTKPEAQPDHYLPKEYASPYYELPYPWKSVILGIIIVITLVAIMIFQLSKPVSYAICLVGVAGMLFLPDIVRVRFSWPYRRERKLELAKAKTKALAFVQGEFEKLNIDPDDLSQHTMNYFDEIQEMFAWASATERSGWTLNGLKN